ncbi:OmpH family outer membrane protein [Rhodovulum kholense]|uniref:Periplasmic chaperone for outer membrane proteins Skp n=1 Tax=Rhodovulum kholense TaxID=453584 RepID=A0A8E2VP50_9RHOB|nr:OmpH family outer membrane protein [Rhodovulum kholense]PTW51892.1 periplasmic chaperone for outer membrane proteins Skp [Rhodovulum kholense]
MRRAGRGWALAAAAALGLAGPALAQDGRPVFLSPILTLDQDRLFQDSEAGQAIEQALEAEAAALAAENRRIESELVAEERALTEQRATVPPDQFRPLAEAFDTKVETIRAAQERKARELTQRREEERQDFFRKALPVLAEIVRERGAVAVLAREAVILSAGQVDITTDAIALLDERVVIGPDGAQSEAPDAAEDAPATPPGPASPGAAAPSEPPSPGSASPDEPAGRGD